MRLTKTSYLILAIVTLMALVDSLFDNRMGHIWPLIATTWGLLLFVERIIVIFQNTVLTRDVGHRLYLGQTTEIQYHLLNNGKRPIRLHTTQTLPSQLSPVKHTLHWDLAAHEQQTQTIQVTVTGTGTGTGTVMLQHIHASVLGWLALAWWERKFVCPDRIDIRYDHRTPARQLSSVNKFASTTFVINADKINQLQSGALRRLDYYANHCLAVACQALNQHRTVNFFVYDCTPKIAMSGIKEPADLAKFMHQLQELPDAGPEPAQPRCILNYLDNISSPGSLIWYTDIDDTARTAELINITRLLRQRFQISFYHLTGSETRLLADELRDHSRGPYHDLAMIDLQQQWHNSQMILQKSGIQSIRR